MGIASDAPNPEDSAFRDKAPSNLVLLILCLNKNRLYRSPYTKPLKVQLFQSAGSVHFQNQLARSLAVLCDSTRMGDFPAGLVCGCSAIVASLILLPFRKSNSGSWAAGTIFPVAAIHHPILNNDHFSSFEGPF